MQEAGHSFAPGAQNGLVGRAAPEDLTMEAEVCMGDLLSRTVLDAADGFAVIVNAQRQILAANAQFTEAMAQEAKGLCRGSRLGEAMSCVHMSEGPDGCGTSRACTRCGMLASLISARGEGKTASGEWLASVRRDGRFEAREFRVRSMPLAVGGHALTLMTFQDTSAEKRRDALERVFIHDLMQSLKGLRSWSEMLQGAGADPLQVAERVIELADHLRSEVESQHRLLQAECGEVVSEVQETSAGQILDDLERTLGPEGNQRLLRVPSLLEDLPLRTDSMALGRVLSNMAHNAFEAMPLGGQACVWFELREGRPTFVVQNPGCMPPEVADCVFHRSFSTKSDRGRGLGTYGMKVLGETVLGGKVGFTSAWEAGTQFFIELPAGMLVPRCLPTAPAPSAGISSSEP